MIDISNIVPVNIRVKSVQDSTLQVSFNIIVLKDYHDIIMFYVKTTEYIFNQRENICTQNCHVYRRGMT